MKELVTTCDHCGKKLNEMHDYVDTEFDTKDNWLCVDLCSECYAEISKNNQRILWERLSIKIAVLRGGFIWADPIQHMM